jgi:hypothetical protein
MMCTGPLRVHADPHRVAELGNRQLFSFMGG